MGIGSESRFPAIGLAAILVSFMACTLDCLAFASMNPLFVPLVSSIESDPKRVPGHLSMIMSTYAIVETFMSFLVGALSDRFGRRIMVIATLAGTAVSAALLAHAETVNFILIARLAKSVTGGQLVALNHLNTFISDITNAQERPNYMIAANAAFGVAFWLGPLIGGFLGKIAGISGAHNLVAYASLANCLLCMVFMKESKGMKKTVPPPAVEQPGQEAQSPSSPTEEPKSPAAGSEGKAFHPLIWLIFFAVAFLTPVYVGFAICAPIFIQFKFCDGDAACGAQITSECFSLMGLTLLISSLLFYKPALKFLGLRGTTSIGGIVGTVGIAWAPFVSTAMQFRMAVFLWSFGGQFVNPALPQLIPRLASPAAFGRAFGLQDSFANAAKILAPPMFAAIVASNPPMVFITMAICTFMTALLLYTTSALAPSGEGGGAPAASSSSAAAAEAGAAGSAPADKAAAALDGEAWERQLSQASVASAGVPFGGKIDADAMAKPLRGRGRGHRRTASGNDLPRQLLDPSDGGTELARAGVGAA